MFVGEKYSYSHEHPVLLCVSTDSCVFSSVSLHWLSGQGRALVRGRERDVLSRAVPRCAAEGAGRTTEDLNNLILLLLLLLLSAATAVHHMLHTCWLSAGHGGAAFLLSPSESRLLLAMALMYFLLSRIYCCADG